MREKSNVLLSLAVVSLFAASSTSYGQAAPVAGPNSDPVYQQLRNIGLGSEAVTVKDFELKRDAARFHLHSGTVCFVAPVQGKVTGAVFVGDGNMTLTAPTRDEERSLKFLTKEDEFNETFEHLVLRFTDSTYEELKKAGAPTSAGCDAGLLQDSQHTTRKKLNTNISARILQDVLSDKPGGLFVAFVHGKHYDGKMLFMMDPDGAWDAAPDEVALTTYGENKSGTWAAFHWSPESANRLGTAAGRTRIHIEHQQIETTIEKNAHLNGKATTSFVALTDGVRAAEFNLFPTLRVQSVTGENGQLSRLSRRAKMMTRISMCCFRAH